MSPQQWFIVVMMLLIPGPRAFAEAPGNKMKVFILAGQSNMVGWGDSLKLSDDLREGNDRVLMFEGGRWQPLRPFRKAMKSQDRIGMTEFSFGPEVAFAHEMAKAWPDEKIGIVKFAVGGTSIRSWKPGASSGADPLRQGRRRSLYQELVQKIDLARKARDIDVVGFLWLQGGGDMKNVALAKEYLDNLTKFVAAIRKDIGVPDLPVLCGSARRTDDPSDLSDLVPHRVPGRYFAVEWVLKAQWDAQKRIPNFRTVILRDIETHPMNVHDNTAGQFEAGKLFAQSVLDSAVKIGDQTPRQIIAMFGAKGRDGVEDSQLASYRRIFGFIDADRDGHHSEKEFIDDGRYLTRQARRGIFRASDSNRDGTVSEDEYIDNRIITDEAKAIFEAMDADDDGLLTLDELIASRKIKDEVLAKAVFTALDSDASGELDVPEYLRVWGRWARSVR